MKSGVTFVLVLVAFPAAASARLEPNAFLNRRTTSTRGLVAQVRRDPQVADRYRRHFAMTTNEVVRYLGRLHRAPLAQAGSYTVYSAPKDGRLRMHVETLKRGEPMFVDASGRATLLVKCGNPVTLGPARAGRGNPVAPVPTDESLARTVPAAPDVTSTDASRLPVALVPSLPATPPPAPPSSGGTATEMVRTEEPISPVAVPATASGGGAFPWLAGLPLLFPIVGSIHHGGGGGDNSTPEPASFAALGVGAAFVVRRRRRPSAL